jgi:hypothetical protein
MMVAAILGACSAPNPAYHGVATDARPRVDAADARAPDGRPVDGGPSAVTTLLGYWKLDERADSTTANDSSGNGNNGAVEGLDARVAWVAGYKGNALDFGVPAQASGVRVSLTPALANLTAFTVAAWTYRTTAETGYDSVLSRQLDDTIMEVFNLAFFGDQLTFILPKTVQGASVLYKASSSKPGPLNQWVHVAATFDGATVHLYQDGAEVGAVTYPYPLPSSTAPLYLGTNKNPSNNEPFAGRLDEVVIYSSALAPSAIAILAAGGAPPAK